MNKTNILQNNIDSVVAILSPLKDKIKSNRKSINRLLHFFSFVSDFRERWKIKYKLENILCICLLLSMKGEFTSFYNASIYIKVKAKEFKKLGLIEDNNIPSHDTLRRIFMYIDANELRNTLINRIKDFVYKLAESDKSYKDKTRLLSADGKTFNGSGRKNKFHNINVFNILDASSSICISSTPLESKDSEIKEIQRLLPKYDLNNTIVTCDALHCQRKTAEIIVSKKGDYLFKVKDNQEALKQEIINEFKKNRFEVIKRKHNKCYYQIILLPHSFIGEDFPYQKAYIKMNSFKRNLKEDELAEDQYFITSTNNVELIIEAIDNRWEIEGGLHWFKDDFNKEDECTFTNKNAIQVMATFNNITYALYRIASAIFDNQIMAETRIRFKDHPEKMLYKLIPLLEKQNLSNLLKDNLKGYKKK